MTTYSAHDNKHHTWFVIASSPAEAERLARYAYLTLTSPTGGASHGVSGLNNQEQQTD